jgi:hypothetical protein
LYNSDSKAGKQDKEKSGRKPRHHDGAKSQYSMTKRAVFMESCFSPLSALGSKIRVHCQNKIPFGLHFMQASCCPSVKHSSK